MQNRDDMQIPRIFFYFYPFALANFNWFDICFEVEGNGGDGPSVKKKIMNEWTCVAFFFLQTTINIFVKRCSFFCLQKQTRNKVCCRGFFKVLYFFFLTIIELKNSLFFGGSCNNVVVIQQYMRADNIFVFFSIQQQQQHLSPLSKRLT